MDGNSDSARGIDVSHWEGQVDWARVMDEGFSFGIVKATEGSGFIDATFDPNWLAMRRVGLVRGVYHFYRPGIDPIEQAEHFLEMVGGILHSTDLPPILDVEAYPAYVREEFAAQSLSERIRRLRVWLEAVERALERLPMIYTNHSTWREWLGDSKDFQRYPLWIANFGVRAPKVPAADWGGQGWTFWQYSEKGACAGVADGRTEVDLDLYKGSEAELFEWLGWGGPRPQPLALTNALVHTALGRAAGALGLDADGFLSRLGLAYLIQPERNRHRPYDGPAVEEMELSDAEAAAVRGALEGLFAEGGREYLSGMTNQAVINAFYRVAEELGLNGWALIERAGVAWLVDDRGASYAGPVPRDLPGLTLIERRALCAALGIPKSACGLGDGEGASQAPLTNQDVINAFYRVADELGVSGWGLLKQAGLTSLVEQRYVPYSGPSLEGLSGLTEAQRRALRAALGGFVAVETQESPYPGLLNQEMLAVFYHAAWGLRLDAWALIERAGLSGLAASREARCRPYQGPPLADISALEPAEVEALQAALAEWRQRQEDEA